MSGHRESTASTPTCTPLASDDPKESSLCCYTIFVMAVTLALSVYLITLCTCRDACESVRGTEKQSAMNQFETNTTIASLVWRGAAAP